MKVNGFHISATMLLVVVLVLVYWFYLRKM